MKFMHWFNDLFSGLRGKRSLSAQIISSFIGFVVSLFMIGPTAIWPTNSTWLNKGDAVSAQIAWNYFRHTPLLQWPPTLISNYGMGWSTYFTGAGGNVLVGVPLRLINPILPDSFQYLGFWMVVCFVLQGYFAARILSLFLSSRLIVILLSINFILAPVFVYRIGLMSHAQLGAQWLLLCAVFLYLKRDENVWHWSLLVAISHLIEIYISAVIILVVLSFFISNFFSHSGFRNRVVQLKYVALPLLTSGTILWLLGFFAFPDGVKGDGFFRFSTTTFFDPRTSDFSSSSLILNSAKNLSNQTASALVGESFMYLGTGTLFGLVFSAVFMLKRHLKIDNHHHTLFLLGLLLFLVGLSRKVSVGPFEFSYWWPSIFDNVRQTFRAATRFGWLLYYLVFIAVSVVIGREALRSEKRLILVILLLVINALDQTPLYASTFAYYRNKPQNSVWFESTAYESFSQYSSVFLYPVFDIQKDKSTNLESENKWRKDSLFMGVLLVSSELNMKTNFAYQSRSVGELIELENSRLSNRIESGIIYRGELFAFSNSEDQLRFAEKCLTEVKVFSFGKVHFVGRPA